MTIKKTNSRAPAPRVKRETDGLRWGEGTIKERARSDGSIGYQARWTDDDPAAPVERSKTFGTRDAAEDFLRDQHRAKRDGRYAPPETMTVQHMMTAFIDRHASAGDWKPNTVYLYRQSARLHILPVLGSLKLTAISTLRIQRWIDAKVKHGVGAPTMHRAIVLLKYALSEATVLGILTTNPAIGVRKPTVTPKESVTWTADDVARIMKVVRDKPKWHAVYRVALATGMRPGELRALRWSDIDLERGVIHVQRTISRDADGRTVIGSSTKTSRNRLIAITPEVVRILEVWRTQQKRTRMRASTWTDDGNVFTRRNGLPLDEGSWSDQHVAFIGLAGVPPITLHQLRHSYATLELESGTHPEVVSERLGHHGIQTTLDTYSHVSLDLQRAAARTFEICIFGEDGTALYATT